MTRIRSFCIVFHNVKDDSKPSIERFFNAFGPTQMLCAIEPYPEDEGFHVHVFVCFKNPRQFAVMLSKCEEFSTKVVAPRPEGEERDWGRVQVDRMRGSFEQATEYLKNPKKDKICDPDVTEVKNPDKDEIKCDVCGKMCLWIDTSAQYMVPRGLGRCRKCACIPHRMLTTLGFEVRNLDRVLGFTYLERSDPN